MISTGTTSAYWAPASTYVTHNAYNLAYDLRAYDSLEMAKNVFQEVAQEECFFCNKYFNAETIKEHIKKEHF